MSLFAIGIIAVVICFILIFIRMPIAFSFAVVGFVGIWLIKGAPSAFNAIAIIPYSTLMMYVWTCFPLFVLMGFIALNTELAGEFYTGVNKWVGHLRGGLAMAVVLGNTAFGACTGNGLSAAVTFSAISLPFMRRYKYDDKLTLGSVCAGSLLAGLIPPSMGFIIYGAITQTSIGQLFIAGIFPGLILAGLYIAIIYFWCRHNPNAGPPGPKVSWKERWGAATGMWAMIAVFAIIIGGLFIGLFTPTEAGGAGAFTVLVIGLLRRKLSWRAFKESASATGVTTGMIILLLVGTMIFNRLLVLTHVPAEIALFIGSITQDPVACVGLIVAILLILGCFIDSAAILLIMTPIFFPIVTGLGVDPIHYGVVQGLAIGIGSLTPPFGITVYAVSGVAKDVPLFDIFRGSAPFLIANLINIAFCLFIPQICLFLPGLMFPAMR
jgi:tripartite ATP-independent transporter DctM subunit